MAVIVYPFDPIVINEGFGWSEWRQGFHDGLDIAAKQGTPLQATATGRVLRYYSDDGGAGIDIKCDDGTIVRHWHLSQFNVANGAYVQIGDIIGLTGGAPGTWGAGFSTGAHLHWGTKVNGTWVDPQTVVSGLEPQPEEEEMANSQYFIASSDSPSGLVKTADVWVRPAPGEALHYLTAGQAHDWFAMQKLDYNAPNVFSKEGGWFDLAFQEDNLAAQKNSAAGKVK